MALNVGHRLGDGTRGAALREDVATFLARETEGFRRRNDGVDPARVSGVGGVQRPHQGHGVHHLTRLKAVTQLRVDIRPLHGAELRSHALLGRHVAAVPLATVLWRLDTRR